MARDIARALGHFRPGDGYLSDGDRIISWALGHLAQLAEPADYNPRFRHWRQSDLPIIPPGFRLSVIAKSQKQFRVLAGLLGLAGLAEVINACDAGREGELIFRHIYRLAGCQAPVRRLWISSLTEESIRVGFAAPRPGEEFDNLGAAAEARSQADWLVGLNATRAYTLAAGDLFSLGRVQTPTLALIVRREAEIDAFVPQEFWMVEAVFSSPSGEYRGIWSKQPPEEGRLASSTEASAIARAARGAAGTVVEATRKDFWQLPPMLYDLSELQREMNRQHGMTAARTLQAAQSLYETHKALTYPRTDSRYLTPDLAGTVGRSLSLLPSILGREAASGVGSVPEVPGRVYNAQKVSDHHAIIPTGRIPKGLGPEEERVFMAVVRRLAAAFSPSARIETVLAVTAAGGYSFVSRGKRILDPGWMSVEPAKAPSEAGLPPLAPGTEVRVAGCRSKKSSTKPPPRYTEAALISAMETAGKMLASEDGGEGGEEEVTREVLKGEGLGTPATRAAIIERLVAVGYLVRHGKSLKPTPKGRQLIAMVRTPELTSAALTGRWEYKLRQIEGGTLPAGAFMEEIIQFTRDLVRQATMGGELKIGSARARRNKAKPEK